MNSDRSLFEAILNNDVELVKQYLDNETDTCIKSYDFKTIFDILYQFKDYVVLKLLIISDRIDKKNYKADQYIKLKTLFTEEDIKTLNFEYIINI